MLRRQVIAGMTLGALAPWAWPRTEGQRRLGDGIGLNVMFSQGQPLDELPMLTDLGVRWVRDHLPWRVVEPRAGWNAPWPPAWRERLAFYREHDIGLVCVLGLSNDLAYPPSSEAPAHHVDPGAFGRHAAAMARGLSALGLRFVLEIGNEPHNGVLQQLLGGDWAGRPPAPWLEHYVRMVAAATATVKSVDPAIAVLSDDDMWVTHYRYLDAGLPPALDGFAVHPYVPGGPERTLDPAGDWMQPHRVADDDRALASAVRRLRERGEARLGHLPSIWLTEWGWPVAEAGQGEPRFIDEPTQAARLPRAFILAEAAGVTVLCWYVSKDIGEGSFGLVQRGGVRRAAYDSLRTLQRELGDWSFEQQLLGQLRPGEGLQIFLFRRGAAVKLALWHADEVERTVRLSGPWMGLRAVDARGRAVVPVSSEPDAAEWRIGGLPLYFSGESAPGDVEDWARHVD